MEKVRGWETVITFQTYRRMAWPTGDEAPEQKDGLAQKGPVAGPLWWEHQPKPEQDNSEAVLVFSTDTEQEHQC